MEPSKRRIAGACAPPPLDKTKQPRDIGDVSLFFSANWVADIVIAIGKPETALADFDRVFIRRFGTDLDSEIAVAQPLWKMTGSLLAMEIRTGEG
jgi:hypothetical protein